MGGSRYAVTNLQSPSSAFQLPSVCPNTPALAPEAKPRVSRPIQYTYDNVGNLTQRQGASTESQFYLPLIQK